MMKLFRKNSLYKKIFLSFFTLLLLSVAMVYVAFFNIAELRDVTERLQPYSDERNHAVNIERALNNFEQHTEQYVVVGGEEFRSAIGEDLDRIDREIALLGATSEEVDSMFIADYKKTVRLLRAHSDMLLAVDILKNPSDFNHQLQGVYETLRATRLVHIKLLSFLDQVFKRHVIELREITSNVIQKLFFIELAILLIGVLVTIRVTQSITRPIMNLRLTANQMTEGDYNARANVEGEDELGELAQSFNVMAEHLSDYTEDLERRVKDRTEELNEKVAALDSINNELDQSAILLVRRDLELSDANDRLRELDRIKSEFLSVAAHQLRTPLAAIKWIFSIFAEQHIGALTPEQHSYVLKGETSTERMVRLVDDMLTVTRIESGKEEYNFYILPLGDILRDVVGDSGPRAALAGLEISYEADSQLNTNANIDSEKLRFVFENIIDNAIKYTPRGGKVSLLLKSDGEHLVVSIRDTGIGISEVEKKNIFTKFFRGSHAMKVVTDGTGLGLFVARSIVLRHSGEISFDSAPGKGTTFRIVIPKALT